MRVTAPALEGRLQKRYKRFLADVELEDGTVLTAHCPNTGSLLGCKEPGSKVLLRDSENDKRKLRYTWQAIKVGRIWVNVDTGLPNALVLEAAQDASLPEFEGWDTVRREVKYGKNSRIDVLLEKDSGEKLYVEVKNTTLADGNVGLFPDAVTERGRKHLDELIEMVKQGHRAMMFFVVSRSDVGTFRPADDIDPKYGETLRRAVEAGVEVGLKLALFDLDGTLLDGDTDEEWTGLLEERGLADRASHEIFAEQYRRGVLDVEEFFTFHLSSLAAHPRAQLELWRDELVEQRLEPRLDPGARELLQYHATRGAHVVVVTGTNRFLAEGLVDRLPVHALVATEPEEHDGDFTGRWHDPPCFREGKLTHVERWLAARGAGWEKVEECWAYSDSISDLPLLERATHPVAVRPDAALREVALERGWPALERLMP